MKGGGGGATEPARQAGPRCLSRPGIYPATDHIKLQELEEIYWLQRSKINWLGEGDNNTKFFHITSTIRNMRNHISGLPINGDK